VPYIAVIGGKEVDSGHVNVQDRGGNKVDMPLESFMEKISAEIAERRH
jgi:threonyl-tRNA synthetase